MQSQLAFCRNNPWKLALPLSLKQPLPPTSKPSMAKTELRPSCTFRKRPRRQTKRGSKQLTDRTGRRHELDSVRTRTSQFCFSK